MPGNAFSDPGPYCIANTPGGRPLVTRAKPSAMSTPTRSCRQMIGRMPAATAFSMIEVVGKQNSVVHALPLQDFDDGVGGFHGTLPW